MSWWSSGWNDIASQATQAFKTAQTKIDKALDIEGGEESEVTASTSAQPQPQSKAKQEAGSDFWNSWLTSTSKDSDASNHGNKSQEDIATKTTLDTDRPKSRDKKSINLEKKFSEDNVKTKPKLSPRLSKEKDSKSTESKKSSGGWGFNWAEIDSQSDSWTSVASSDKSPKKENEPAITQKRDKKEIDSTGAEFKEGNHQKSSIEQLTTCDKDTDETCLPILDIENETFVELQKEKKDPVDEILLPTKAKISSLVEDNIGVDPLGDNIDMEPTDTESDGVKNSKTDEKITLEPSDFLIASDTTILSMSDSDKSITDKQEVDLIPNDEVNSDFTETRQNLEVEDLVAINVDICDKTDSTSESSVTEQTINKPEVSDIPQVALKHDSKSSVDSASSFTPTVIETVNIIPDAPSIISTDTDKDTIPVSVNILVESEHAPVESVGLPNLVLTENDVETVFQESFSKDINELNTQIDITKELSPINDEERKINDAETGDKLDISLGTSNSGDTITDNTEGTTENLESESLGESFVNVSGMLEEAMADMIKLEDGTSENHDSNGEKSESSKVESEIDKSVSGHDSSDDIETTTSSDIEIISTPTPNGEYKLFDLSPLKLALQKTVARGTTSHRRTDSQSSSSTYSKAGESDAALSPGRDSVDRHEVDSGDDFDPEHRRSSHDEHKHRAPELSVVSEESNNPYQTDKLLKTANKQELEIVKKLADTAEVLQARENKLVQLSKENNDLLEANSILRSQLEQSELAHEAKMEDVDTITEEFKMRITEGERKLNAVIKEKENLKKQLNSVQDELHKKVNDRSQQKLIEEKDEQIKELLEEGEKLSKQQLQSNNIIKKLRAKEKENDSLITSQKSKIEEMKKELEHLRKVCDSKADLEKKQTDAINQLNSAVQKQEKELLKYRSEDEDHQEKLRSLQVALDNSYKEIAELHKANAAQDSKATQIAQSLEQQIREEAQFTMNKELMKARAEKESLIMQIEDLRISMARVEKEQNRKEDMLRQEISDLQYQLQADELRNQELSQNVSSTTRPLLRQIENLQAAYKSQASSFEKVEKNLADRLNETQNQLAIAVEKERTASEKLMDITAQITSLEAQNSRLKQDKTQLIVQSGLDKTKIEMLEESKQNEMAHIEAIKNQMSKEITELKRDKVFLESQIEVAKNKVESEKRRCAVLDEQIKILERERPKSRGTPSPISVSRQDSIASFTDQPQFFTSLHQNQDEILERSLYMTSPNNTRSVYEQLRHTGASTLIEGLESQLKLKEGEITQLQSEISQLERTRESMAKELVNLTNQVEELEDKLKEYPELLQNYKELDGRYNAILQMYGEKVEETEELKLDLEDVKEMYKQQINHLLTS